MRLALAAVPLITLLLPIGAAQAQAPGSYRGSCNNISQDGSVLSARCRTPNGNYSETSIDLSQCRGQPVANSFGRLACGNVRGSSEPIQGDQPGYGAPPPRPAYGYGGPPRPRYGEGGDAPPPPPGYGHPPPRFGAPPPGYYRQPDPDEAYAPPRPPRPRRYDPDQDY